MKITIECERCNGSGEVETVTEPVRGYAASWNWPMRCNACMGNGAVEVEVQIVLEKKPPVAERVQRFPELGVTVATFWNPVTSMVETWQFGDLKSFGVDELLARGYQEQAAWQHRRIVRDLREKAVAA